MRVKFKIPILPILLNKSQTQNSKFRIWKLGFVWNLVVFGFGSISILFWPCTLAAEPVAKIIAKVNNQIITSRDLDDYCKVLQFQLTDSRDNIVSEDSEFRKMALNRLIEDKLILGEAKRMKVEIPRAVIDGRFNEIAGSHSSREAFEQSLKERGLTVTKLKERIKEQYLMRGFIEMQVKSLITISPQELSNYYVENKSKMLSPTRYIFYIATSKDKSDLERIADKIENEGIAKAFLDYGNELMKLESSEAELRPEIAEILDSLKSGQSKVAKMEEVYYLVFREQELEPVELTLSEAQAVIRSYLWDQKFKKRFTEWIKKLRQAAVIKIYNE